MLLENKLKHFEALLESAKKFKQQPHEKTFFDTAIRNHYENPTTELLEFFLNPQESHELGDVFWKGFSDVVQAEIAREDEVSMGQVERLERECVTHSGNRIDLILETDSHLLLVEAKIYHQQNNPFNDYVKYAKTRSKGKEILGLILSISGKSEARNWYGISYQQLVNAVRPYLAEQMLNSPMNKWNLFAREFLLHLESYYKIQNLDMNRVQFIFDHYQEIQELQKLKTNTIKEVVEKISQQLNLMIDNYDSYNKYESWGGIRFYNHVWGNTSNTTLYIHENRGETVFGVNTYILNLPQELEAQALNILNYDQDERHAQDCKIQKYKGERWLCIYWHAPEHTFEAVESLILEKASLLDKIEKTLR